MSLFRTKVMKITNITTTRERTDKFMAFLKSKGFTNVKLKPTQSWPTEPHHKVEISITGKDIDAVRRLITEAYFSKYPDDGFI